MIESGSVFLLMMGEGRARGNLGGGNDYVDYLYCADDFTVADTFQNLPNTLNYTLNICNLLSGNYMAIKLFLRVDRTFSCYQSITPQINC